MSRYIDADALSGAMYHEAFETDTELQRWDSGCWIRYKLFEDILEQQPTADVVEINRGYWKGKPIAGNCTVRCSVCGSAFLENDGRWNFCPNCGAKMDGEKE